MSKKRAVTRIEILEVVEELRQGDPDYRSNFDALSDYQKENIITLVLHAANNFDDYEDFKACGKQYEKEKSPSNSFAGVR